jgi:hypothetical protein
MCYFDDGGCTNNKLFARCPNDSSYGREIAGWIETNASFKLTACKTQNPMECCRTLVWHPFVRTISLPHTIAELHNRFAIVAISSNSRLRSRKVTNFDISEVIIHSKSEIAPVSITEAMVFSWCKSHQITYVSFFEGKIWMPIFV